MFKSTEINHTTVTAMNSIITNTHGRKIPLYPRYILELMFLFDFTFIYNITQTFCDKFKCPSSKFTFVTASGSRRPSYSQDPNYCCHKTLDGDQCMFCYDSCQNVQTDSRCLSGDMALCPTQSVCTPGKKYINDEYYSDHPSLVEITFEQQCKYVVDTMYPIFPFTFINQENIEAYQAYC